MTIHNQKLLIGLLSVLFPDATIYLFGSRARGDHRPESDIDIALNNKKQIDVLELIRAANVIEALNIPHKVDLVDMYTVPEQMRAMIKQEGVIWKN
jgi:predicted nucleotidyltransferase